MITGNPPKPAAAPEKPVSTWVWAFRCIRWSTYLAALITLILLLHKTPPPQVQSTPQAAASAEKKLEQVEQTVSQGQKATLRLDESEVNSYLASHLDLAKDAPVASSVSNSGSGSQSTAPDAAQSSDESGAPSAADIEQVRNSVKDVKVQMEGDQVRAYVVFDVHGKDMTLNLVGKLGSQDGYLKFEPVSGQIGSLPIPQSTLESAVKRLMESPENREKLKLPADVSDMHIENGQLVATYQ
jgi:chemotaxis protein histidine kinase CheA